MIREAAPEEFPGQVRREAKMKQRTLITWAAGLCLAAAVCIALYPAVSSYVNEKYRSEIRTAYSEELAGIE